MKAVYSESLMRDPSARDLRVLHSGQGRFDDRDLVLLRSAPKLEWLRLQGTDITDAGIANLAALPKLRYLRLKSTRVTNACIPHLAKLTSLTTLQLQGTRVMAEGLLGLAPLANNLRLLVLGQPTGPRFCFTRYGAAQISQVLPDTEILVKGRGVFLGGRCQRWTYL